MKPMDEFIRILDARFADEISVITEEQRLSHWLMIVIGVVTIAITIANYMLMQNVVLSPLTTMGKVFGRLDDWAIEEEEKRTESHAA